MAIAISMRINKYHTALSIADMPCKAQMSGREVCASSCGITVLGTIGFYAEPARNEEGRFITSGSELELGVHHS